MNFFSLKTAFLQWGDPSMWILKGARILCIAIAFEIALWCLNRFIENQTASLLSADATREATWRMRRRTTLRQMPKIFGRCIIYTIGFLLVLAAFGSPVLEMSLGIGAVVALFAAALVPILRDMTQGYALLAEDTLAVGDSVEIGAHVGIIERFTLRATTLRDREGRLHVLSNRDIHDVVIVKRREETTKKI